MCLALPARVMALLPERRARVALGDSVVEISLGRVGDVAVGDFLSVHVGVALAKLSGEEADEALALTTATHRLLRKPETE